MDKIVRLHRFIPPYETKEFVNNVDYELDQLIKAVNALIEEVNDLKQKLAESKNDFTKFVDWIGPLKM